MTQGELSLLGLASRPPHKHPPSELALCGCMSDAVWLSMRHARLTQELLAESIHVSPAYMSMLLNGKRPWQAKHLERIRQHTKSLATLQYAALREGLDLYVDPLTVREAQAKAELEEIAALRAA